MRLHLSSNPSHLEVVCPVALGRARAKQERLGDRTGRRVLPVLMHGDSAFAGQGILAETLNLAHFEGYDVGGTVHVVVDNHIGFTTEPHAYSSTRYATDVAKRLPIPIFHVNAEDPEAVERVARLAVEYRTAFASDVVIDLIGYRRYGHSEVDDPTVTQPLLYQKIRAPRRRSGKSYAARVDLSRAEADAVAARGAQSELADAQKEAAQLTRDPAAARAARLLGGLSRREVGRVDWKWTPGSPRPGSASSATKLTPRARRLPRPSEGREAARAAAPDGARRAARRLRHGRGARLRLAAWSPASRCGSPARTAGAAPSTIATRC